MFLGYQINEQGKEFVASVRNSKEELENNQFVKYTRIEESNEDWQLVDGAYITSAQSFEKAKEAKRIEINAARDAAEQGGFEYMGKIFDSDPISCQRISCAAQAMQLSSLAENTQTITWTCKDNTTIDLNSSELLGLVVALAEWSNSCHQKATALKEQVDTCQSSEDLAQITWDEGE